MPIYISASWRDGECKYYTGTNKDSSLLDPILFSVDCKLGQEEVDEEGSSQEDDLENEKSADYRLRQDSQK